MAYTMTIDAPENVVSYLTHGSRERNEELGRMFVAYLTARYLDLKAKESVCEVKPSVTGKPKYDFSGFFGKCKLDGDPVVFQRKLRDEW